MIDEIKFSRFLEKIAEALDIPPGKYQDAVERYQAVGQWLEKGRYPQCADAPAVYPQGSFLLGTVTRPIRNGVEADYDIDLVVEFPIGKLSTSPDLVKAMAGARLRENLRYRKMLDPEGRRCWTLQYAEDDGVGFHIDVLPAIPDSLHTSAIAVTNKKGKSYSWSASDPKGYGRWFGEKNREAFMRMRMEQKSSIQKQAAEIYARIEDVPDQLIRTPLQRSIQIAKRHRDMHFNNATHCYAPISIIITTLFAHLYRGENDVYSTLQGIISQLEVFSELVEYKATNSNLKSSGLIRRTAEGSWHIDNPTNPEENFADRWHEDDHARARAFFGWLAKFQRDCVGILGKRTTSIVRDRLTSAFGAAVVTPYIGIICPPAASQPRPPKIHIDSPSRPWGTK